MRIIGFTIALASLTEVVFAVSDAVAAGDESSGGKFAAPVTAIAPPPMGGGGPGFLQIFGSLLLVIATILAIGWLAKRFKSIPRTRAGALRLVDDVALGPKERAVLIEVDGARLVLGVGDGRVALLHRSEQPATLDLPDHSRLEGALASTSVPTKFVDLLRQSLGK